MVPNATQLRSIYIKKVQISGTVLIAAGFLQDDPFLGNLDKVTFRIKLVKRTNQSINKGNFQMKCREHQKIVLSLMIYLIEFLLIYNN